MPAIRSIKSVLRRGVSRGKAMIKSPALIPAGRPNTANPWFQTLQKQSSADLFVAPTDESAQACTAIQAAYRDVIAEYGVPYEKFFGGSIKDDEAHALHAMIRARKPQTVYQIGTFIGYSAMVIADALHKNGTGRLVAMDPEIPHRTKINPVDVARRAADVLGLRDIITFERGWHSAPIGDDMAPEWKATVPVRGPEVLAGFDDASLDMAFIDGDHSTAMTIMDFMSLKEKLSVGGIAVFHDAASWPTVAQAIWVIWHDILYYRKGTPEYFNMDVRRGFDGLAAFERIKLEARPTLKITILAAGGAPVPRAQVAMPSLEWSGITGDDGIIYAIRNVPKGTVVNVTTPDGALVHELTEGTRSAFHEITLRHGTHDAN